MANKCVCVCVRPCICVCVCSYLGTGREMQESRAKSTEFQYRKTGTYSRCVYIPLLMTFPLYSLQQRIYSQQRLYSHLQLARTTEAGLDDVTISIFFQILLDI